MLRMLDTPVSWQVSCNVIRMNDSIIERKLVMIDVALETSSVTVTRMKCAKQLSRDVPDWV